MVQGERSFYQIEPGGIEERAERLRHDDGLEVGELVRRSIAVGAEYADQYAASRTGFTVPVHQDYAVRLSLEDSFGRPTDDWEQRYETGDRYARIVHEVLGEEATQSGYWNTIYGGEAFGGDSGPDEIRFHRLRFLEVLEEIATPEEAATPEERATSNNMRALITLTAHQAGVRNYIQRRLQPLLELVPGSDFPVNRLRTQPQQKKWWKSEIYGEAGEGPRPEAVGLSDAVAYHRHLSGLIRRVAVKEVGAEHANTLTQIAKPVVYMRTSQAGQNERVTDYYRKIFEAFNSGNETEIRDTYHRVALTNPELFSHYSYTEMGRDKQEVIAEHEDALAAAEDAAQAAADAELVARGLALTRRYELEEEGDTPEVAKELLLEHGYHIFREADPVDWDTRHFLLIPVLLDGGGGIRGRYYFRVRRLITDPTTGTLVPHGDHGGNIPARALYRNLADGLYEVDDNEAPPELIGAVGYAEVLTAFREGIIPTRHQKAWEGGPTERRVEG